MPACIKSSRTTAVSWTVMNAMKQSCTPENTKLASDSGCRRRSSRSRRQGCSSVPLHNRRPGDRSASHVRRGSSISTNSTTVGRISASMAARQPAATTIGGTISAPRTPPSGTPIWRSDITRLNTGGGVCGTRRCVLAGAMAPYARPSTTAPKASVAEAAAGGSGQHSEHRQQHHLADAHRAIPMHKARRYQRRGNADSIDNGNEHATQSAWHAEFVGDFGRRRRHREQCHGGQRLYRQCRRQWP